VSPREAGVVLVGGALVIIVVGSAVGLALVAVQLAP
jgi:hypothetical protein